VSGEAHSGHHVLQLREPHRHHPERLLTAAAAGKVEASIPAHGMTTLFYLMSRFKSREASNQVLGWLLETFEIAPAAQAMLQKGLIRDSRTRKKQRGTPRRRGGTLSEFNDLALVTQG